ncbi:MAG: AAA family ATPase [Clostridia bacterium]|nr:AAA family ATPase [Clostridia bacterium]
MMNYRNYGYNVIIINETATEIVKSQEYSGKESDYEIAGMIVNHQLKKELEAENIAKNALKPYVIVCDRSIIEPAAYIGIDNMKHLLEQHGKSYEYIRDSYDLVIHITTAAKGAEEYYTKENNEARSENIVQARNIDDNILQIWSEHPNRFIVDNLNKSFNDKLEEIKNIIIDYITR